MTNVNVVGMPEFDELMDHIYEYGTVSEGVIERANAFARAVIARYAPQQPADDEVVFVDGVGAGRSSIAHCHGGVQWIRIKNRVYWPLSDADAQRLQSACCGNGSFDGPAAPAVEGVQALLDERDALGAENARLRDEAASALALLARMRAACGDDGMRMQDELDAYLRELRADAERYRWLRGRLDCQHCIGTCT